MITMGTKIGAKVTAGASAELTKDAIVRLCYAGLNPIGLALETFRKLRAVFPCEEPCWLATDLATALITGAVWENFPAWAAQALTELEQVETFNNLAELSEAAQQRTFFSTGLPCGPVRLPCQPATNMLSSLNLVCATARAGSITRVPTQPGTRFDAAVPTAGRSAGICLLLFRPLRA